MRLAFVYNVKLKDSLCSRCEVTLGAIVKYNKLQIFVWVSSLLFDNILLKYVIVVRSLKSV